MQVDVKNIRKPMLLFQWMGMNALIIYALGACELFAAAVKGFYWRSPENNLVSSSLSFSLFLSFQTTRAVKFAELKEDFNCMFTCNERKTFHNNNRTFLPFDVFVVLYLFMYLF